MIIIDDSERLQADLRAAQQREVEHRRRLNKIRAAAREVEHMIMIPGVPINVVQAWRKVERALGE